MANQAEDAPEEFVGDDWDLAVSTRIPMSDRILAQLCTARDREVLDVDLNRFKARLLLQRISPGMNVKKMHGQEQSGTKYFTGHVGGNRVLLFHQDITTPWSTLRDGFVERKRAYDRLLKQADEEAFRVCAAIPDAESRASARARIKQQIAPEASRPDPMEHTELAFLALVDDESQCASALHGDATTFNRCSVQPTF